MKPMFTDQPEAWLRASRISVSKADYASPITVYQTQDSWEAIASKWCLAGIVVVVALVWGGVL